MLIFAVQSCPKLVQIWSQIGPKLVPNWSQIGPRLVPDWSQFGPKSVSNWFHVGPNLNQNWSRTVPQFVPKLVQNCATVWSPPVRARARSARSRRTFTDSPESQTLSCLSPGSPDSHTLSCLLPGSPDSHTFLHASNPIQIRRRSPSCL